MRPSSKCAAHARPLPNACARWAQPTTVGRRSPNHPHARTCAARRGGRAAEGVVAAARAVRRRTRPPQPGGGLVGRSRERTRASERGRRSVHAQSQLLEHHGRVEAQSRAASTDEAEVLRGAWGCFPGPDPRARSAEGRLRRTGAARDSGLEATVQYAQGALLQPGRAACGAAGPTRASAPPSPAVIAANEPRSWSPRRQMQACSSSRLTHRKVA
jgi:hypothetical protein